MALDDEMIMSSPQKSKKDRRRRESGSDTDFAAAGESDGEDDSEPEVAIDPRELEPQRGRSVQGMRTKAKARSPKTPQKFAVPRTKQRGSVKRATPRKIATPIAKQKAATVKNTRQKPVTSAKGQGGASRKPANSVETPKASGSTRNAPETSSQPPQVSPKSANSSGKENVSERIKPTLFSSEMQKPLMTQASSSNVQPILADKSKLAGVDKKQVVSMAPSVIYEENADKTGEAQGVTAGPSNTIQISSVSFNMHESRTMITQPKANEAFSQTSTDPLSL